MTPQGQPTTSARQALVRDGALTGSWILDPARSEIRLETRHTWGLRPLHGVFRQVTGNGTVTAAGQVTGILTVAAGSIDTKNKMRDKDLRSAKLFDIANHPDITYTVDGMEPADGGVRVTGSLTVRGRTRPLSFDAMVSAAPGEVRLDAEVLVNRADFGLTYSPMRMASMNNTITVCAVFTRQLAHGAARDGPASAGVAVSRGPRPGPARVRLRSPDFFAPRRRMVGRTDEMPGDLVVVPVDPESR